ncbi:hypothetical protein F4808DRAFT_471989 [Astrocystis sublimbata]|nr:hypothetical protein F4808DRAFT_471989 [Astrocystis sublimbata]
MVSIPRLDFGREGYSLSRHGAAWIPQVFRDMELGSIYVEFLRDDYTQPLMAGFPDRLIENHTRIKVEFSTCFTDGHGNTYRAAYLDLVISGIDIGDHHIADVVVVPEMSLGTSAVAVRACRIGLMKTTTLEQLLWAIESKKMQTFAFAVKGVCTYGSRDFVSQVLYRLRRKGITDGKIYGVSPANPGLPPDVTNIWQALGYCYKTRENGMPYFRPMQRGRFAFYQRHESPSMEYQDEETGYYRS